MENNKTIDSNFNKNLIINDFNTLLQNIFILLKSNKNRHRTTALNSGILFIKIISEVKLNKYN
jgi:hypothetical protein